MAAQSATTTLMTFLLRTPPSTRSVTLLGSWDNFSKEYKMEKDSRVGRGQWRGCPIFTNIICDGQSNPFYPGRDGALKMGGTYWYYYRLDDDIDYHNEAEPWTTSCPFLPGQPVNILNVPVYLPSGRGNHSRDNSEGSDILDHRTMNPDDKYLNPRAPPRPRLPRLATSPAMLTPREALPSPLSAPPRRPVHERSASYPRDAAPRKKFRIPGKLSLDLRPASPTSSKASGLRSVFLNFGSGRSPGGDRTNQTSRQGAQKPNAERSYRSRSPPRVHHHLASNAQLHEDGYFAQTSRVHFPNESPIDPTLVAPPALYNQGPPLNPQYGRRDDLGTGSPLIPPLKTSISRTELPLNNIIRRNIQAEATQPRCDSTNTPTMVVTCKLDMAASDSVTPSPVDLYTKRLPTLPNSPSSVLDEFASPLLTEHQHPDLNLLHSHFSQTTAGSPNQSPSSFVYPGGSRFSEFSTDTDMASPCSMTSSSTFNNGFNTSPTFDSSPDHSPAMVQGSFAKDNPKRSESDISNSSCPATPSATNSLLVSGLNIRGGFDCEGAGTGKWQPDWQLHLPWEAESTPKQHQISPPRHACSDEIYSAATPRGINSEKHSYVSQSDVHHNDAQQSSLKLENMMQELIDEMSYLGSAID